jgi:hypothetical protein
MTPLFVYWPRQSCPRTTYQHLRSNDRQELLLTHLNERSDAAGLAGHNLMAHQETRPPVQLSYFRAQVNPLPKIRQNILTVALIRNTFAFSGSDRIDLVGRERMRLSFSKFRPSLQSCPRTTEKLSDCNRLLLPIQRLSEPRFEVFTRPNVDTGLGAVVRGQLIRIASETIGLTFYSHLSTVQYAISV